MFTGIIESLGIIEAITIEGTNKRFRVKSDISKEVYIDQSIAHNGVCLTVVSHDDCCYELIAIEETLKVSNLDQCQAGDLINLERCMLPTSRMDGHMVQGHVDTMAKCQEISEVDGSWYFTFVFDDQYQNLLVSKGSVCVNGVSLTVVDPQKTAFKVAIIPYTYEHTNFKQLKPGDLVNIEFDIVGKYVTKYLKNIQG